MTTTQFVEKEPAIFTGSKEKDMALDNGGLGEGCILLFGLNDNIKFASMGVWAKIQV
ncbi:hypothetical protein R6Q59_016076 [Mikania micrantha]